MFPPFFSCECHFYEHSVCSLDDLIALGIVLYLSLGGCAGLGQGHTAAGRYQKGRCPPVHNLSSYPLLLLLPTNWIGTEAGLFFVMWCMCWSSSNYNMTISGENPKNNKRCNYFITASSMICLLAAGILFSLSIHTLRVESAKLFGCLISVLRIENRWSYK